VVIDHLTLHCVGLYTVSVCLRAHVDLTGSNACSTNCPYFSYNSAILRIFVPDGRHFILTEMKFGLLLYAKFTLISARVQIFLPEIGVRLKQAYPLCAFYAFADSVGSQNIFEV